MGVFSMAKNWLGWDEVYDDELPVREAIPINSRQAVRPTVVARSRKPQVSEVNEIFTIDVRSFADAQRIGEEYRDGKTVIANLGDLEDGRRIVDFMSGLVFALNGSSRRVTSKVFLLSHAGVSVEGDTAAEDNSEVESLYIRP
ncbi:MAG: hypothetical protein RL196_508 [Actinomycetota bacterium]|jgi:cell division inhibitor SepF